MSLWNNRIAKSSDEHSLVEEQLAHLDRFGRLPQDDGHDGRFTWQRFEPQNDQALTEIACVLVESGHELGVALEVLDRREGAARHRGRGLVGKELREEAMREIVCERDGAEGNAAR